MESILKAPISIEKVKTSKIDQVDFDNLAFGSVFSDHMLVCDYKNGAWAVSYTHLTLPTTPYV